MVSKMDVRLMVNPNEFTSRMPEDLPRRLRKPVAYHEALFDPAVCVFQDGANYWSVKSVADTLIELHGCGGDVYPYRPPGRLDKVEWFAQTGTVGRW